MTGQPLTPYQQQQLLHLHLEGQFQYRTPEGTKVPRPVWRRMIDALAGNGFIDEHARITQAGREYLDQINTGKLTS